MLSRVATYLQVPRFLWRNRFCSIPGLFESHTTAVSQLCFWRCRVRRLEHTATPRASEKPIVLSNEARGRQHFSFWSTGICHSLANVHARSFSASPSSTGSTTVGSSVFEEDACTEFGKEFSMASMRSWLTYGDAIAKIGCDKLGCCVVAMTRCHILLFTSTVFAI